MAQGTLDPVSTSPQEETPAKRRYQIAEEAAKLVPGAYASGKDTPYQNLCWAWIHVQVQDDDTANVLASRLEFQMRILTDTVPLLHGATMRASHRYAIITYRGVDIEIELSRYGTRHDGYLMATIGKQSYTTPKELATTIRSRASRRLATDRAEEQERTAKIEERAIKKAKAIQVRDELRAAVGPKLAPYVSEDYSAEIDTHNGMVNIEIRGVLETDYSGLTVAQAAPLLHTMLAIGLLDKLLSKPPFTPDDEED